MAIDDSSVSRVTGSAGLRRLHARALHALYRLALTVILVHGSHCDAQRNDQYPTRTVTLVVGFPAGGESDHVARLLADELGRSFGQTLVVQNRGGAGGIIAAQVVAAAPADGYTLLLSSMGPLSVAPPPGMQIGYRPAEDLVAVSLVAMLDLVLVVHPSIPAHSLPEFVAFVKANPGRVTYASSGIGSASQLAGELFKQQAGLDMVHVPYQGAQQIRRDLIAGDVLSAFAPPASVSPQVQAGNVRALASTGESRTALLPQLPTFAEQGYPGYHVTDWYALVAPAHTPEAILASLNRHVVRALNSYDVTRAFTQAGWRPAPTSMSSATSFIHDERERWRGLLFSPQASSR